MESTPKHKDLEFEIIKSDFLAHRALVARHYSDIVRLFGDIQMRMFELSNAQIQSHFDDYAEVTTARCPLLLVIKSHTFAGREASFVEKEKAKSTLQKLRQSSLTLSEHNSRFDAQLKICKDMQIDVDTKWVIYTYLLTLNVSTFGQLVTIMITEMGTPNFPRTLEDAKRRIDRFAQSSIQVGLQYRGSASPGQSQDVFTHTANIPPESDRAKPKNQDIICAFCDKQGHSAQECHSLKRWRAKNSTPSGAKKPSSPSDGRPPPERRDQVGVVFTIPYIL